MNRQLTYKELKEYVWKFWDAHRSDGITIDDSPFQKKALSVESSSNSVSTKNRKCEHCVKHGRKNTARTHRTDKFSMGIILI